MAKRNNETVSVAEKAKVRVFFAELEGNNESVQEALKTMVSAMGRPVRVLQDQSPNGTTVLLPRAEVDSVEETINQAENVDTIGEDHPMPTARRARGSGKRNRNAGLELIPNLNFRPNGQQHLKEFVEDKSPKDDVETTLAFVYYMQRVMSLSKIGPEHVVTAFKEAGKAIPVDLKQTIRNLKKAKVWVNFSDIENIRTTTQGDNFVQHEMSNGE